MAANSILKLKVDNTEYDANIKKAAEGIQHLAKRMHDAQGDFEGLDKESLDFIKNLQYMTTSAKTASGQYRELENAYKNLAATYEGLNAFEKEGDAGKALAEQLEILKNRTLDMKANMDAASKSLQTNAMEGQEDSSALSKLADKFVVNVDALKLFNIGLNAAKGALDVAKDAFMSSEANVDEWGRVMDSSKSLYEGFLTALNTGDISGYLSRIDSIVQAAREAYNELDRLGTMKTIQAPQMSAQQTENERIRSMIQTGRYIAPIDGRRNAVFNGREMQSGDKLTAGQIRALEKQLQNGIQKVVTLVGNEVEQTSKAIDAVYKRQAKELGMDLSEFRKGTSSMAEFDKRMKAYDDYQKWRNENYYTDNWGNRRVKEGNPFEEYKKWGTFRVDGERYNDLVRLIQQRDQQAGQAYGMQSQSYRAMNRAEGFTVSKLMKGGNGGKGGKTEQTQLQKNQAEIAKLTQEYVKLGDVETEASRKHQAEIQKEIERLQKLNGLLALRAEQAQGRLLPTNIQTGGLSNTPGTLLKAPDTSIPSGGLQLSDKAMNAVQKNISKQLKDVDGLADKWGSVSSAISAVGNAMAAVEDPAAKVLGIVAQAIATVALTFAKSLSGTITPWDWIAAAAAGTATMISTISAIHSATGYAEGGMIKGNSYSGDNILGMVDGGAGGFVGLDAGEIVLNKSQQATLAQNLQGSGLSALNLTATIKGEQIRLALNNNGRRTGRGEYVQSRNVR